VVTEVLNFDPNFPGISHVQYGSVFPFPCKPWALKSTTFRVAPCVSAPASRANSVSNGRPSTLKSKDLYTCSFTDHVGMIDNEWPAIDHECVKLLPRYCFSSCCKLSLTKTHLFPDKREYVKQTTYRFSPNESVHWKRCLV
jgi:hypothetical protein